MPRALPHTTRATALRLLAHGHSPAFVAAHLGLCVATVYRWRPRAEHERRHPGPLGPRPGSLAHRACALLAAGPRTSIELAAALSTPDRPLTAAYVSHMLWYHVHVSGRLRSALDDHPGAAGVNRYHLTAPPPRA